jgi:ArsR family transcriptional regulator
MPPNRELEALLSQFTTLGDVSRLRMLVLLEREELSVGELARILQLPQSTVSRHLKILSEAGWLARRTEGTAGFYRLVRDDLDDHAAELWTLAKTRAEHAPQYERDMARLAQILAGRSTDTHSFFGRVGGEWDRMRRELFGDRFTWQALLGLLPADWRVADIGCATGNVSAILAPHVREVVAVDIVKTMLDAARKRLKGHKNVRFVKADLVDLPLEDASVDAAVCVLVLHHIDEPQRVVAEMQRIVKPGGPVLVVDMCPHEHESYRHTMGHVHLGFFEREMRAMAKQAGFATCDWRELPPEPEAQGPQLFAAVMRRRQ